MVTRRTDLAMEAKALWEESAGEQSGLRGVAAEETVREGFPVTTVKILDREGEQALGKPAGTYVTLLLEGLLRREEGAFGRAVRAVAGELQDLLALDRGESVLVVGLGNRAITPDAIGPKVSDLTLVTRHLVESLPQQFGSFRKVSALAAGVLGSTGIESRELIQAVVEKLRPHRVIAVDALASRSLDRVCTTVQIADTGIVPGSGVGNARAALDRETLGVPVVAVGVPTVVDAATLCADVLSRAVGEDFPPEMLEPAGQGVIVTPREIDSAVEDLSRVVGYAIDLALQPELSLEDVEMLVS